MSNAIRWMIQRLYVFGLLLVVVWCTWAAFAFLYESVFVPRTAGPEFSDHVLTANTSMLIPKSKLDGEPPKPLDHYHGLVRTPVCMSPAGCQTSGCHPILPHQASRETRAFINMHVTFMDCMTCHAPASDAPRPHQWVDPRDGRVAPTPAMLQLMDRLEKIDAGQVSAEQAAEINALLEQALFVADEPTLREILVELTTASPNSPVHRHALRALRAALPKLARGDYGVLLTPESRIENGRYQSVLDAIKVGTVGRMNPRATGYQQAVDDLHKPVVARPDACLSCHSPDSKRIDFARIGYTQARADALRTNMLADMIERIRGGEPFYLPTMLEVGDDQ